MKKIILYASFMLCSLASFAYYGDYGSESNGFMTFLGILILIWGILNIILFFKLWGATNDIDKIAHKLTDEKSDLPEYEIKKQLFILISKDKKEEGVQLLNNKLEGEITYYLFKENDNYYTVEELNRIIQHKITKYMPYYKTIGAEIPTYFEKLKVENYHSFKSEIDKNDN